MAMDLLLINRSLVAYNPQSNQNHVEERSIVSFPNTPIHLQSPLNLFKSFSLSVHDPSSTNTFPLSSQPLVKERIQAINRLSRAQHLPL